MLNASTPSENPRSAPFYSVPPIFEFIDDATETRKPHYFDF